MSQEPLPPSAAWADGRLIVRASPIEGRGLFFDERIGVGAVVMRLGGRLVSSAELSALINAANADPRVDYIDSFTVRSDQHLVLPPRTPIHFGNHSCAPSLWLAGPQEIATRFDVSRGDEATIDYGTFSGAEGFEMTCHCGADACRGRVTSDDWRRPDLQARYRGHWAPALQARIADL